MPPIISVEHLSKAYRLGQIGTGTFTNDLKLWWAKMRGKPNPLLRIGEADHGNRDGESIWALKDVSFTVEQGEVLGIIGRNGAGKSTLLKILSRVTAPTSGRIRVKGRVASLLEVGTGFHPELTGRENIYLNGAILGMSRKEIDRKFDEIVDFAEIEKFIDTPVKRYSSGMYVRLAFAVAAHLEPEILVVDEVLAVGDAEFQKKCLGKMGDVAAEGRTVLFVSHNLSAVANLCNRGLLLVNGKQDELGLTELVISKYVESAKMTQGVDLSLRRDRKGTGPLKFYRASIYNEKGKVTDTIDAGRGLQLHLEYKSAGMDVLRNIWIDVHIWDQFNQLLFTLSTFYTDSNFKKLPPYGILICEVPTLPITSGTYKISLWCKVGDVLADFVTDVMEFSVIGGDFFGTGKMPEKRHHGPFLVTHKWDILTPVTESSE